MIPGNTRRMTPQRSVILEVLQGAMDHPTAGELFRRVRTRLPRISLGTVYRNLDVLAAEGLAVKLAGAGSESRYDGTVTPHDHARCRHCGGVQDIPCLPLPDAAAVPDGFMVESRRLEYVGLCADCRSTGSMNNPVSS